MWTIETRLRHMFANPISGVMRLNNADNTLNAARCLIAAGFKSVEVTMTTPDALNLVKTLAAEAPADVLVGAGTAMSAADARAAIEAGAQFVVSAICETDIVRPCREAGVVCIPAGMTPTEIVHAWRVGAHVVKIFPAAIIGGPNFVRAIRGPLPDIPLWVSGMVPAKDVQEYLRAGANLVGLTNELFPANLIQAKDWPVLTEHMKDVLRVAERS
ncbi:MAG: bifunctional 4-hydroxy-2-oxoglutarate aldolase/2-dehydro-3-deoxy-phosphogluconate aldolase [Chloroflexota bacterium]